jgi:hypothetical protein
LTWIAIIRLIRTHDEAGDTLKSKSASQRVLAQIAQSVEQRIENPRVPGSIPGLGTIYTFDEGQHHTLAFCLSGFPVF